jgi:hypothetical protein
MANEIAVSVKCGCYVNNFMKNYRKSNVSYTRCVGA